MNIYTIIFALFSYVAVFTGSICAHEIIQDTSIITGIELMNRGKLDSAKMHFLSILQRNPRSDTVRLYLGNTYLSIGQRLKAEKRFDEVGNVLYQALDYFKNVLTKDGHNITALINSGMVYYELNKFNQAKDYLEKALSIWPDNTIALRNMGNVLFWLNDNGDYQQAIECWNHALCNMQEDIIGKSIVWKNIGIAYYKSGLIDSSLKSFKYALTLDSTAADTYVWYGRALATMGRLDKAIDYYKYAISIDSFCAEAYGAWTELLYTLKDEGSYTYKDKTKELKDHINMILTLNPQDKAQYYLYLGHILLAEGNYNQAVIQYDNAIKSDSSIRIPDIQ